MQSDGDWLLGYLREARATAIQLKEEEGGSRELSLVLTKIDEAILWRQFDIQIKTPPINLAGRPPEVV